MKLNREQFLAAAMMIGALNAAACKRAPGSPEDTKAPAGAETAPPATMEGAPPPAAETGPAPTAEAPLAPPPQLEIPGVPPSSLHFWSAGHWQWNLSQQRYIWIPGNWGLRAAPALPPVRPDRIVPDLGL
jgi:hypothetical protein